MREEMFFQRRGIEDGCLGNVVVNLHTGSEDSGAHRSWGVPEVK